MSYDQIYDDDIHNDDPFDQKYWNYQHPIAKQLYQYQCDKYGDDTFVVFECYETICITHRENDSSRLFVGLVTDGLESLKKKLDVILFI